MYHLVIVSNVLVRIWCLLRVATIVNIVVGSSGFRLFRNSANKVGPRRGLHERRLIIVSPGDALNPILVVWVKLEEFGSALLRSFFQLLPGHRGDHHMTAIVPRHCG